MESFRCYDNSDVIATLIMTNFDRNIPNVCLWRRSLYSDLILSLKTVSSHLHMPGRPCCCNVALICFLLFRKNFGNLRDFLGKWFTAPPGKKFPVRLCRKALKVKIYNKVYLDRWWENGLVFRIARKKIQQNLQEVNNDIKQHSHSYLRLIWVI